MDEHIDPAIARGLRLHGVNVLSSMEAGNLGLDDPGHLNFAFSEKRVLVTMDSDFLALHKSGVNHYGIVYIVHDSTIGNVIRWLTLMHQTMSDDDMQITVDYV